MADDIPWVVRLWDGARLCGEVSVPDDGLGCYLVTNPRWNEHGDIITDVYRYTRVDEHTRTIDAFLEPCR